MLTRCVTRHTTTVPVLPKGLLNPLMRNQRKDKKWQVRTEKSQLRSYLPVTPSGFAWQCPGTCLAQAELLPRVLHSFWGASPPLHLADLHRASTPPGGLQAGHRCISAWEGPRTAPQLAVCPREAPPAHPSQQLAAQGPQVWVVCAWRTVVRLIVFLLSP